uniref:Right handed beta helix domain-containing protein n=1 Tax=Anopheles maculatus TaxID=74869 RepID=A0A182SL87_9DIPT
MDPNRFRISIVFLISFLIVRLPNAFAEQEQLEEIVHQPLHCERIDNSQSTLVSGNDWGTFHGRIGERVMRCDCHESVRQRRSNDEYGEQQPKLRSYAFVLPAFPATTVATDILVVNCQQLLVPGGTFRSIRPGFLPRTIRFVNIEQLTLESFAFESGGSQTAGQQVNPHDPHPILGPIMLSIERCQLDELPANVFHGAALRSVLFSASSIGVVRPLAISTRFQQFIFSNCAIGHFARHSFKRAQMEQVYLHNVTMAGAWTSQAWQGIIVSNSIQISDSSFLQTIHPAAITESSIRISNDSAWNAQPTILLERNLIDTFTASNDAHTFFAFPRNFTVNLENFRIAQLATCESTNVSFPAWAEIYFLQPFATGGRNDPESYITVEQFRSQEGCDSEPDMVLVIVLATLLGVSILGGIVVGLLCWRHQRKRQRMLLLEQNLVHPVPRTYRETQILLKLETVGQLKTDF